MPIPVYFVLTPGVLLLDFAGASEALRIAAKWGAPFDLHFVGLEPEVVSSLALPLGGLAPLPDTLPEGAWVCVPGVSGSSDWAVLPPAIEHLAAWLHATVDPARHRLVTICSGALLAARAGLLAGRACTTHHTLIDRLRALEPKANVMENRVFVVDGPVLSSAGITAGIDLALHWIAQAAGAPLALQVAREMVVYFRRAPNDAELSPWLAYRNHLHPAVHRVQDLIAAEPDRPWSVAELADHVHVSARHLSRLFREQAGVTVHDYHSMLKLALARQWQAAGLSREKAALAAGFSSARQMRRHEVAALNHAHA